MVDTPKGKEGSLPISVLKQSNSTIINLSKYIPNYDKFVRYRLMALTIVFMDKNGKILPNQGNDVIETAVTITFPSQFVDSDFQKNKYSFYSTQEHQCRSAYTRLGNEGGWRSSKFALPKGTEIADFATYVLHIKAIRVVEFSNGV